ncbi:MAG TPA: MmcQ/YjbR family DNA-binding protein [Phycicoccus sp.]|jgi:hypothetical protein|nr:MmcQ/YjbR family DNA-binding protein [Phycicoccus sp.]HQK32403.1 MmcQ/YjbR family DNA-binding protein [Phycicoccus sp.]
MPDRPDVPDEMIDRIRAMAADLPECHEERAWVGTRWRVAGRTVAHVFGGEDGIFRITLRGDPEDVAAFEHLGPPYFRTEWGRNVIGMMLGDESTWTATDWDEVGELVTISYLVQAPRRLKDEVSPDVP